MKLTTSEADYLKGIFSLQSQNVEPSPTLLAAEVRTTPASVTDMLKKLKNKKLINYDAYKGFSLTKSGNKQALMIVRKHRLWEYFLSEKLGISWEAVHEIAEQLEHIESDLLIQKLDEYLGHPTIDPHGEPIPMANGDMQNIEETPLSHTPIGSKATITSVRDKDNAVISRMQYHKLQIGSKLLLKNRFDFDGTVELQLSKTTNINLSQEIAARIFCTIEKLPK